MSLYKKTQLKYTVMWFLGVFWIPDRNSSVVPGT